MTYLEWMVSAAFVASAVNMAFTGGQVVVANFAPAPIEGMGRALGEAIPGKEVIIQWDITKRTNCPGVNSRVWHGQNGFFLNEKQMVTSLPATFTPKQYLIPTYVPAMAPVGPLTLSIVGQYKCPGGATQAFTLGPVNMEIKAR